MRRTFITLATLAATAAAGAVVVDNVAGMLQANIADREIAQLTVTGTIDARDFKFIADSLTRLKSLDLSQAQIVAYSDSLRPLSGTIFNFPANELPANILMGTEIDSIALPDSLTSIGHAALAGCTNLTSIVLPESLTSIGSYAFSGSGLTQVTVPEAVASIGEGAWAKCGALESVTLNTVIVPDHAFMGDTALTRVALGTRVATLGKSAFNGCSSLKQIEVGEENNIATIGVEAFLGAGAQDIDLSAYTALQKVDNYAFAQSGLTSAVLPQGVTELGDGAFMAARSLTQATLTDGLTAVPALTFAGSNALKADGLVPEGIESIGDYAFYNLDSVSVFTVPASVGYIGSWAMAGMVGLDTVNAVPTVVPELGDSVWGGINQPAVMLNTLSTPNNDIADLYGAAEQWREFHILRNYLVGDVNLDGTVDVADVNAIVAFMLGSPTSPFDKEVADMNSDGQIDVEDVNALVTIILSGENQYVRKSRGIHAGHTTGDRITLGDLNIAPGKTATVALGLSSMRDYTGLQFDIELPQGLRIVEGSLKSTDRTNGYAMILSPRGNRVLMYSPSMDPITQGEGDILTFTVMADDDAQAQGTIAVTDLHLSTAQSESWRGDDAYAQVDNVTGVDNIDATNDRVWADGGMLVIDASAAGEAQIVDMSGRMMRLAVEAGRNEKSVDAGVYVVRLAGKSYKVAVR